jgi:hypothetical protein
MVLYHEFIFDSIHKITSNTGFILFLLIKSGILMCIMYFVSVTFFMKKRFVPKIMIFLCVYEFVFACISLIIAINLDVNKAPFIQPVISKFIGACIWIPYFLYSQRVKATFVK